jgi:hypothetical protein
VEVFVARRTQRFECEVIDDQYLNAHELLQLAFIELSRPCCMQLLEQFGLRDEQDIAALTCGAVAQGLRKM